MGRFYKTAQPYFAGENAGGKGKYNTLISLLQQEVKQQNLKNQSIATQSNMYANSIDSLKHLTRDDEGIREINDRYTAELEEISRDMIDNPSNYKINQQKINKIGKGIKESMINGKISYIKNRHAQAEQFEKDNEDYAKDNPGGYNKGFSQMMKNMEKGLKGDETTGFGRRSLIEDFNPSTEFFQELNSLNPNKSSNITKTGYITEDTGVNPKKVENLVVSKLMNSEKFRNYSLQQGKFYNQEGYLTKDEDGKVTGLLPLTLNMYKGKEISNEEYKKLDEREKSKVTQELNSNHAYYNRIKTVVGEHSYNQRNIKSDPQYARRISTIGKTSKKGVNTSADTSMVLTESLTDESTDKMFEIYANLKGTSETPGKEMSSKDIIRLAQLEEIYAPIIDKSGDEILDVYGEKEFYNREENKNKKDARIVEIIRASRNTVDYTNFNTGSIFGPPKQLIYPSLLQTKKSKEFKRHQKKINKIVENNHGSLEKYMTTNLAINTPYNIIGEKTERIRHISNYMATVNPAYYQSGVTSHNILNEKRPTTILKVDGKEGNVFSNIFSKIEDVNNLVDAVEEGILTVGVTSKDYNNMIALITLNGDYGVKDNVGKSVSTFKIDIGNLGNKVLKKPSSPEELQNYLSYSMPNFAKTSRQFDIQIMQRDTNGDKKFIIHDLGVYDNLSADISYEENGDLKVIFKNRKNGNTSSPKTATSEGFKKNGYDNLNGAKLYISTMIYQDPNISKELKELNKD